MPSYEGFTEKNKIVLQDVIFIWTSQYFKNSTLRSKFDFEIHPGTCYPFTLYLLQKNIILNHMIKF